MKKQKPLLLLIMLIAFGMQLYAHEGYGIAPYEEPQALLEKPVLISRKVEKSEDGRAAVLKSDCHTISDVQLSGLGNLLADLDRASEVFSRITLSTDLTPDRSLNYPHKQEILTSYKFLGMGPEYRYRVWVYFDEVTDSEFAMHWEMYDSMGSNIEELSGSWYLRSITIEGEPHTYVRNRASTTISSPPPGMLLFTNLFGEGEIIATFKELLKELQ